MKNKLFVFIGLSIVASAINYFSYPVLSRLLPASQYVNVTVALSLLTQIGTFLAALTAVTIGLAKGKESKSLTEKLQLSVLQIFTGLSLVFLAASPLVMHALKMPSLYAVPIVVMILASIPVTILSGYLNGKQYMSKLGGVALTTALMQFIAGAVTAYLSRDGLVTIGVMSISQIVSIIILYILFRDPDMPALGRNIFQFNHYSKATRRLLTYTIVAAFCIMALNILQILDLLLIKNSSDTTAKFYTDVYVISRVVFFGGMIFIWPFLGELSHQHGHINNRAFGKLGGIFLAIGIITIIGLTLAGQYIMAILFGKSYDTANLMPVLYLSVTYKLLFLVITAIGLFFAVQHSYRALRFTLITLSIIVLPIVIFRPHAILSIIATLTISAAVAALIGTYGIVRFNTNLNDTLHP